MIASGLVALPVSLFSLSSGLQTHLNSDAEKPLFQLPCQPQEVDHVGHSPSRPTTGRRAADDPTDEGHRQRGQRTACAEGSRATRRRQTAAALRRLHASRAKLLAETDTAPRRVTRRRSRSGDALEVCELLRGSDPRLYERSVLALDGSALAGRKARR